MVCANYCAPYPKQPYVIHEVNMVSMLYDVTCSRTFYNFPLSSVINVVTIPSNVTDVIDHF